MRIIDKNTDFYDYVQGIIYDTDIVFDRTDSFLLTKNILCNSISKKRFFYEDDGKQCHLLLLQVCNTFWLFSIKVLELDQFKNPVDYDIEFICAWKNYNKEKALIKLDVIYLYGIYDIPKKISSKKNNILIQKINSNEYFTEYTIDRFISYIGNKRVEKHIPLLKSCGLSKFIDPIEIFLSLREYFSSKKSDEERTEAIGTTNLDKIENHGFDIKTSFRGKR